MVTAADLTRAADALCDLSRATGTVVADTAALADVAERRGGATSWWLGPQGDDLRTALLDLAGDARSALGAWESVAGTLQRLHGTAQTLAAELAVLEHRRDEAESTLSRLWRATRSTVEDVLDVDVGVDAEEAALAQVERAIAEVEQRWALACRSAAPMLDGALAAVTAATRPPGTIRLGALTLPTGDALDLLVGLLDGAPPPGADPAAVAAWWSSLSIEERRTWIGTAPQVVGNLDGVPFPARIEANRIAIQALVDSLPEGDPLLERLSQFLVDGVVDPERKIILFDPTGDGRVAELFGNLDQADHIAVIVPGMGSTMDNFDAVRGNAEALYGATPGSAVIAWTGYDAPAAAETGRVWEVATATQAIAGGAALVPFLAAVRHDRPADLTLIGHSYGSLTVGQSLLQGAQADRVVFIGSPGTGVEHVSQFPGAGSTRFFAGEVDGDPVATLERYGDAPTDPDFGAFAFDAGTPDSRSPLDRHSEYFDQGAALDNLATIVAGGEPAPDRPRLLEHGLELREDLDDAMHQAVDTVQDVATVPFVDPVVDDAIDGVQLVDRTADQIGEVLVETPGHYVTEGGRWVWDRGVDAVGAAGDALETTGDLLGAGLDGMQDLRRFTTSWR